MSTYAGDELQTQTETRADGCVISDVQDGYDEDGNVTLTTDGDYADPTSPRLGDGDLVTTKYDGDEVKQTTDTTTSGWVVSNTQYGYDGDGNVTQTVDGDSNTTTNHYDGDEVTEAKVTNPHDGIDSDLQYQYDKDSNVTQTTDGDANVTTTTFDGDEVTNEIEISRRLQRVISDVTDAYDKDGNVTQTTDGDNNVTTTQYDGDEVTRQTEKRSSGRTISDLQYLYDEDGNTIASADGDQSALATTSSAYVGDGSLTVDQYDGDQLKSETKTDQNGHLVSQAIYGYDEDGNATQTTDGDGTVTNDS